jgi:hypothetical protein
MLVPIYVNYTNISARVSARTYIGKYLLSPFWKRWISENVATGKNRKSGREKKETREEKFRKKKMKYTGKL